MFLLAEDEALHKRLRGMKVSDQKSQNAETLRDVGVWYGQPDQEIRAQSYPYVTLDMLDVIRDTEREHRGVIPAPEYMNRSNGFDADVNAAFIDYPIPVAINYQVTTYSRDPRHDRAIIAQLLYTKLPLRAGSIELDDGTVRRLDVLDIAKRDVTEADRRLFVNSVTVSISSEVAQGTLQELFKVQRVNINEIINLTAQMQPSTSGRFGLGNTTFD
jgi:hypothetical protein